MIRQVLVLAPPGPVPASASVPAAIEPYLVDRGFGSMLQIVVVCRGAAGWSLLGLPEGFCPRVGRGDCTVIAMSRLWLRMMVTRLDPGR